MSDRDTKRFKIKVRNADKQVFSMSFTEAEESLDMIEDLNRIKGAYEKQKTILRIRGICKTEDNALYYPKEHTKLPKARWVTVSATASYPRGVPVDEIVSRTGLTPDKVSAYCTSRNNPTSNYLFKRDGVVFITPDGIDWLFGLLKKDMQIDEEVEKIEENILGED